MLFLFHIIQPFSFKLAIYNGRYFAHGFFSVQITS